jgi:hypothetical protein
MSLSCFLAAVVLLVPHPVPDDRSTDFDPHLDIVRNAARRAHPA